MMILPKKSFDCAMDAPVLKPPYDAPAQQKGVTGGAGKQFFKWQAQGTQQYSESASYLTCVKERLKDDASSYAR